MINGAGTVVSHVFPCYIYSFHPRGKQKQKESKLLFLLTNTIINLNLLRLEKVGTIVLSRRSLFLFLEVQSPKMNVVPLVLVQCKMAFFPRAWAQSKRSATPQPFQVQFDINQGFKMRNCINMYLKGLQSYKRSKFMFLILLD